MGHSQHIFWHFVCTSKSGKSHHSLHIICDDIWCKKALFQQLFSHNVALFSTGGGAQKSQNTQEGLKIDTRIFLSVEGGPQHTFLFYFEPFFLGRDFCPFLVVDDLSRSWCVPTPILLCSILPPTCPSHWKKMIKYLRTVHTLESELLLKNNEKYPCFQKIR